MSILEDYDHDYIPEAEDLETELLALVDVTQTLSTYGVNRTALSLMQTTGLLSGTSLMAIAVESLQDDDKALEASHVTTSLKDKITSKAKEWSAKILSFFTDKGSIIFTQIHKLWDKLKAKIHTTKDVIDQKLKEGKDYAKVHPYRTIVTALTACASVLGIMAFTTRMLPAFKNVAQASGFTKRFMSMVDTIKWPFGPVKTSLVNGGKKVGLTIAGVAAATGVIKLAQAGWNKVTLEDLDHGLEKVGHGLETGWKLFSPKAQAVVNGSWEFAKGSVKVAGKGLKEGYDLGVDPREPYRDVTMGEKEMLQTARRSVTAVIGGSIFLFSFWAVSILYVLYQLIKTIVGGTFHLGMMTVQAIAHANHKEYV